MYARIFIHIYACTHAPPHARKQECNNTHILQVSTLARKDGVIYSGSKARAFARTLALTQECTHALRLPRTHAFRNACLHVRLLGSTHACKHAPLPARKLARTKPARKFGLNDARTLARTHVCMQGRLNICLHANMVKRTLSHFVALTLTRALAFRHVCLRACTLALTKQFFTQASLHARALALTHVCSHGSMTASFHAGTKYCTHARLHASTYSCTQACTHDRLHG